MEGGECQSALTYPAVKPPIGLLLEVISTSLLFPLFGKQFK